MEHLQYPKGITQLDIDNFKMEEVSLPLEQPQKLETHLAENIMSLLGSEFITPAERNYRRAMKINPTK